MIYQKLISGTNPYVLSISDSSDFSFPAHMHHELEILYCIEGDMPIKINNKTYIIKKGQAIVIGSMLSHEYLKPEGYTKRLLIEIGPMLLRENFSAITNAKFHKKIFNADDENSKFGSTLKELAFECEHKTKFSDLFITGNLYKLFGHLLSDISEASDNNTNDQLTNPTQKIEKALELIYYNYADNITVDQAAELCGYCKSNFCKIFKNITGASFHQYLNSYRVNNAEYLLIETDAPIEQIAGMVGFCDSKSFCRVFKSHTGITPGQYRTKK